MTRITKTRPPRATMCLLGIAGLLLAVLAWSPPALAGTAAEYERDAVHAMRGIVRIEQTSDGRIIVLLERFDREPVGLLDDVFIGVPAREFSVPFVPATEAILMLSRVPGGDHLTIRTPDGIPLLQMTVGRKSDNPGEVELLALAHWNAIALAVATSSEPTPEGIDVTSVPVLIREQARGNISDETCEAGGPGATECSANCAGSILGLSIGSDCSVSCSGGFYACCNCVGLLSETGQCTCKQLINKPTKNLDPELVPSHWGAE